MKQAEHLEWLKREFPNQTWEMPAVGMVEEAGELLHATLKCGQKNVWGLDARYEDADWRAEMEDAIGDCAIFCCSLCNTVGWDYDDAIGSTYATEIVVGFHSILELIQIAADNATMATYMKCRKYIVQLKSIAAGLGIDFDEAVEKTWQIVRQRSRNSVPANSLMQDLHQLMADWRSSRHISSIYITCADQLEGLCRK